MIELIETVFLFILAWATCTLLLSWPLAFAYPFMRQTILKSPASLRASFSLSISLSPHLLALILLIIYSQPSLSRFLVENHCHNDVCGPHWLHMPVSSLLSLGVLTFSMSLMGFALILLIRQITKGRRRVATLDMLSDNLTDKGYRLIATNKPLAWCVGYIKPKIYLSQGLVKRLQPKHLNAILAHEKSHAIHHDNLRKLVITWTTIFWPKRLKNSIRQDFSDDVECNSDLEAIQNNNNFETLREAIQFFESESNQGVKDSTLYQQSQRLSTLKNELQHKANSPVVRNASLIKILLTVAFLWLIMLTTMGHFGHPLLEWLFR